MLSDYMSWENIVKRQDPDTVASNQWIERVKMFKREQAGKPFDVEAYEAMVRRGNATFSFGTTGKSSGMNMPSSSALHELKELQRSIDYHKPKGK
jgi:hypothetical protein